MGAAAVSSEAIRGYIRTLRQDRKVSQPKLAEAVKMALRTYKSWELGETEGLDAAFFLRIIRALHGDMEGLTDLPDTATYEDGVTLARGRVTRAEAIATLAPAPDETPAQAARINRLIELLAEGLDPQEAARRVLQGG